MADKLTQVVRCALADLIGLFYEGGLSDPAKVTITELFEALKENGEDVSELPRLDRTSVIAPRFLIILENPVLPLT